MKIKHSAITLSNEGVICVTVGLLPGEVPFSAVLYRLSTALAYLAAVEPGLSQEKRDTHEITDVKVWWPQQTGVAEDRLDEIDSTVEAPAPTVRRSRAPSPAEATPEQLELPVKDPAAPTTRRSRAAAPAPAEVTPGQLDLPITEPAAPATRRSRAAAPAATPEISDLELTKAASEAAEKLGVETVKQIITGFNVAAVNQLAKPPSPQREEFIKKLAEAINAGA